MNRTKTADYADVVMSVRRPTVNGSGQRSGQERNTFELVTKLSDLAEKWLNGCTIVEAVVEKVIVEQLVESMPRDLKIWIRNRKPDSGEDAGDYTHAHQQQLQVSSRVFSHTDPRRCHVCWKPGHLMRDCSQIVMGTESMTKSEIAPKAETNGETLLNEDETSRKPVT